MGDIIMSEKVFEQVKVLERLKNKQITQIVAAESLGISDRQIRNKFKRYKIEGVDGLKHRKLGKPSANKFSNSTKNEVFSLIDKIYYDFGPTLLSETLKKRHNLTISVETLRQWMVQSNRWFIHHKRKSYRQKRDRKPHFGMMIQIDGSSHDWFQGRAPKCTAIVGIDDATSELLFVELHKAESTESLMTVMKKYIEKYGRPGSIYVDYHSVYSVNLNNKERVKITQFARAMKELDIKIIYARSPQAKGRVERVHRILQDHLVKMLRIENISNIDAANEYIKKIYLSEHNNKFSVRNEQHVDLHRSAIAYDLKDIFSIKSIRQLANDYTILYKKRILQLSRTQRVRIYPKDEIVIAEHLDESINLKIRGISLDFWEIGKRQIGKLNPVEIVNLSRIEEEGSHPAF